MIALDATYSAGENLSGIGVYSRELLFGLARSDPQRWEWFYRPHRFLRSGSLPPNVRRRLLFEKLGSRSARIFHGLNQRLPARRFRKQITTFHDLFVLSAAYSTPEFRALFTQQARHAAAASDLIISVSQFTADQVTEYLHVPSDRIRVIHHGVVPRVLPPLAREPIVLCVGAIQKRKNQARLIRAFEVMPAPWQLILAGSAGFGSEDVVAACEKSPARDRIRITGYLSESELSEWYARASLFAFPSLDEGFGMPVIEAMAAGIPVITSNRSALREIAGDAALLIDPEDEGQIAKALLTLEGNPNLKEGLMDAGRQRAREFSWARTVVETTKAYSEL